jgi:ribulose-5-phosphate 4-epimerase/fuculose-1-phosphate aldolase
VRDEKRTLYLERFIHAAIYEARPTSTAVVHAHAEDILPFGVAQATPLRPVIHSGSFMGAEVPVWDIADRFGDTNLLVANMAQGRDLARGLGGHNVVLMRGHGFAAAARSLIEVVRMSVYTPRNARALLAALALGEVKPLSRGEIDARNAGYKPYSRRPGGRGNTGSTRPAAHMLTKPDGGHGIRNEARSAPRRRRQGSSSYLSAAGWAGRVETRLVDPVRATSW